jgi:hypothetical protein
MLRIKEEYTENPNDNVEDLMDDFAKYLDKQNIAVDYVDYSSKTIYVKTVEDLKEARYELRTEFAELRQLGVHIQSSIGTDGLDKDYIKDTKTQTEKLSIKEDFEPYTYVKSKTVYDSDGWTTEYTMYYDEVNDRYVFVFGDSDFYNPNDGYEEFDWECDTEREANDWFDNYNGFEDDLDEGWNDSTDFGKTPEDFKNEILNNIDFIMYKYVNDPRFGIKIVADDQEGNYRISYEGEVVDVSFDTDYVDEYVYTINDEGPYVHSSYEFISSDIIAFIDNMLYDE